MVIKLRKFSTNILTRAAAFFLALVFLVLSVTALYDTFYDLYQYEPEPESLVTSRYEDSNVYFQWLNDCLWDISALLEANDPQTVSQWLTEAGVLYRAQMGDMVYTNAESASPQDLMPESGRWIAIEGGEITIHLLRDDRDSPWNFSAVYYSYYYENSPLAREDVSIQMYVPSSLITERQQQWVQSREILQRDLGRIIACGLPFLLLNVFLCVVTGRRPDDRMLHRNWVDRLWTEVLLTICIGAIAIGIQLCLSGLENALTWGRGLWSNRSAVIWLCSFTLGCGYCLAAPCLFAMVRKAKARHFFRGTAIAALLRSIARLCRGVVSFVRGLFDGSAYRTLPFVSAMFRRRLAYVTGSLICVLFFLFGLLASPILCAMALALEILITWWYVQSDNQILQDMTRVIDQIGHIADGELNWAPGIAPGSPLAPVSRRLSDIGGGMQKSVEKQMQSERMKVELVTNVSHDLKTPLTSIISYVELLSKVDELPPEARDYVQILAQKSDRLKKLVYDLFELAKSTSGNMEIKSEALDFHRLVEQTLGDMQERIDQSGLGLRLSLADPPVTIWADGLKMYRVLQNVIDNALKYSLAGTRIYVDLAKQDDSAVLCIKNTAGYEMDFTADEITERFVRGDKARTAEGSGLGLSIAQSFTQSCGGQFNVAIDGDQFRVCIRFALYNEPSSPAHMATAPDSPIS